MVSFVNVTSSARNGGCNVMIRSIKQSGISTAIIYST